MFKYIYVLQHVGVKLWRAAGSDITTMEVSTRHISVPGENY